MNSIDIDKELDELLFRFKRLKKAIDEENSLSPVQRAAAAAARDFLKQNADTRRKQEGLAKRAEATVEQMQAQRLAQQLQQRGILGTRPPPRQPTDQEMFGHLVMPPEELEKMEQNWGNGINNWFSEVSKPLNARFRSPEEEQAYWDSIRISDGGGPSEGY